MGGRRMAQMMGKGMGPRTGTERGSVQCLVFRVAVFSMAFMVSMVPPEMAVLEAAFSEESAISHWGIGHPNAPQMVDIVGPFSSQAVLSKILLL